MGNSAVEQGGLPGQTGPETPEQSLAQALRAALSSRDLAMRVLVGSIAVLAVGWISSLAAVAAVVASQVFGDVIKETLAHLRWRARRLWLLSLLLLLLDTGKEAFAATGRLVQRWPVVVVSTVAASVLVVAGFTAAETALGHSLAGDRRWTFVERDPPPPPDRVGPRIALPADRVVDAVGPERLTYRARATDGADGHVRAACEPQSGALFPLGRTVVYCSAVDRAGNRSTGSFEIVLRRISAPVLLTVPGPILREARGAAGALVSYTATARDSRGDAVGVRCSPGSGARFPLGLTRVRCSASDGDGNLGSRQFAVRVLDRTAPRLAVPGAIRLRSGSRTGRPVTFAASAADAVDGPIEATCSPRSGSLFRIGTTTVTCAAADEHGNSTSRSFVVTLERSEDVVGPALHLPAGANAEATSPAGAAVSYDVTASDEEDGDRPVACEPRSGSTFPLGVTRVTCTAADESGNRSTDEFRVAVEDTTRPALRLPTSVTKEADGPAGAVVGYTAAAADAVDPNVQTVCGPRSGATFGLGTSAVHCTARDASGNRAEGSFTVTVKDTIEPVLELPESPTLEAVGAEGTPFTYSARATDRVDGDVAVTCRPPSGSTFGLDQVTEVRCSASDDAGNAAHGRFTVTVRDTTGPELRLPDNVVVEATSARGAGVKFRPATAVDVVDGSVPAGCSRRPGLFPIGVTAVACSAVDRHDNRTELSFNVSVLDRTPPELTLPADITVQGEYDSELQRYFARVSYRVAARDRVDGALAVRCNRPSGSRFRSGTTAVRCSAVDSRGNRATGTFSVTVTEPEVD